VFDWLSTNFIFTSPSLSLGFVYFYSLFPIGRDERIRIKFIIKGYDERTWSGFIWLWIGTGGSYL
jgi:hypothetical protein